MPEDLFLGLVTHPATRFPRSSTPEGLLPRLAEAMTAAGIPARLEVHATNDWTPELLTIDRATVEASIDAELDVESRWRRYVDPSVPTWVLGPFMAARRVYRRRTLLPGRGRPVGTDDPGARMVRRLVNIELAHMTLMREAAASPSAWTLIAEDDAECGDVDALVGDLASFMAERRDAPDPRYINVSRSFGARRLGIEGLLTPVGAWPRTHAQAFAAERPITNTVCAILYRTEFLRDLVRTMEEIPIAPVVPIDWKLNEAVMRMHSRGDIGPGDCWTLDPAPVIQSSMVAASSGG